MTGDLNQKIFDKSIDLILVVDRQGNFIRISPSVYDILGYFPHELVGLNARTFVHLDDLNPVREMMRQTRRGKVTRHFDCRYIHRDGNPVVLTWTGVWSEEDNQFFFIGRDITKARELERIDAMTAELEKINISLRESLLPTVIPERTDLDRISELFVFLSTLWVAQALAHGPSKFGQYANRLWLVYAISENERFWSVFASIAILFMVSGFVCIYFNINRQIGSAFNGLGLAVAGVFWMVVGVSVVVANPNTTLLGMPVVFLGVLSALLAWRISSRRERHGGRVEK